MIPVNRMNRVVIYCFGILGIFVVSILIRLPALVNAEHFFFSDEAFMAVAILELMNGSPIFFNYEGVTYHGVLGGITAIPFMKILGVGPLAYALPATLYYSLYVWSTYLLAKVIVPRMAFLVLILMIVPAPAVLSITLNNWPHIETAFLGNIIFLLFIYIKTNDRKSVSGVFFLFLFMGFSIYNYTYSVLHIFSVLILYILCHEQWKKIRPSLSFSGFINSFNNLATKSQVLVRAIDVVIVCFFIGVIFSYVFGGFGLDIAGYSILQINELHKPVFQLAALIVARLIIRRDDVVFVLQSFDKIKQSANPNFWRFAKFGIFGFLIGLSPRIIPIVTGDIKRGGTGFDMDFSPIKLIEHFWTLIVETLPQILGVRQPIYNWFEVGFFQSIHLVTGVFALIIFGVILWSTWIFLASIKAELIRIIKLYPINFHPKLILLIFAALLFISLVLTQHGPAGTRYLLPMVGFFVIWVAIALEKLKRVTIVGFYFLIVVWIGFYASTTLNIYKPFIRGMEIIRLPPHPLISVIDFLKLKDTRVVYTNYGYSSILTFLSKGSVVGTEYSSNARGKIQRSRSSKEEQFAVLLDKGPALSIFQQYLLDRKIEYQTEHIENFHVLWDFKGESDSVNGLRSLIVA